MVLHESLQELLGWPWVAVKLLESLITWYKDSMGRRRAIELFHDIVELVNKFCKNLAVLVFLYLLVDRVMRLMASKQALDLVGTRVICRDIEIVFDNCLRQFHPIRLFPNRPLNILEEGGVPESRDAETGVRRGTGVRGSQNPLIWYNEGRAYRGSRQQRNEFHVRLYSICGLSLVNGDHNIEAKRAREVKRY